MTHAVRYALFLICAVQLVLAAAFFLQWPFVIDAWPFPGTTPLTFILIASFFAAVAGSTLWAAASRNYGALSGIGLDYVMILAPVSILLFRLGASNPQLTAFGFACLVWALFGLGLVVWSIRIPMDRTLPMPGLVRWSFALFVLALLSVAPEHRLGLIVYTAVVAYSGMVAMYYLFIHKPTRVWAAIPPRRA